MSHQPVVVGRDGLAALIAALHSDGFRVLGPTVRDDAIVYDDVATVDDLPAGWTDEQDGGRYRLKRRGDNALFGYAVGPHAWKRFLHPPLLRLWRAESEGEGLHVTTDAKPEERFAFLAVRSCELHAIAIQDRVFLQGPYVDPHYQARRNGVFMVAVNCGEAGGTCFCTSMNTGPKALTGYDIALTELLGETHEFLLEAGSERGAALLARLPQRPSTPADAERADAVVARTAANMGRHMRSDDVPELLLGNLEHKRWDDVAARCLSCGNCTQVCPTCFCTAVTDANDLSGATERTRRWDSCFSQDFSYIHGGAVRPSPHSRYRQWMTHKLASWVEQFGTSGCVGCGRCITWCPVGIDITEEVSAIRGDAPAPSQANDRGSSGGTQIMVNIVGLEDILAHHPFAEGMDPEALRTIVGCCANAVYHPGEYIFREGDPADNFYLIRQGLVALEIHVPQGPPIVVETLEAGDIFGWSWLMPPYKWTNDARASEQVRLLKLDGACLRNKMESDRILGYEIYKRFLPIMARRLAGTRMRIVELATEPPVHPRHRG